MTRGKARVGNSGPEPARRIFDAPSIRNDCDTFHDPVQLERERALIATSAAAKLALLKRLGLKLPPSREDTLRVARIYAGVDRCLARRVA